MGCISAAGKTLKCIKKKQKQKQEQKKQKQKIVVCLVLKKIGTQVCCNIVGTLSPTQSPTPGPTPSPTMPPTFGLPEIRLSGFAHFNQFCNNETLICNCSHVNTSLHAYPEGQWDPSVYTPNSNHKITPLDIEDVKYSVLCVYVFVFVFVCDFCLLFQSMSGSDLIVGFVIFFCGKCGSAVLYTFK